MARPVAQQGNISTLTLTTRGTDAAIKTAEAASAAANGPKRAVSQLEKIAKMAMQMETAP